MKFPNFSFLKNSRNNSSIKSTNRPPTVIIIFFALIALVSSVNLIRELSSEGVQPFGFLNNVVAQINSTVSQITNPPTSSISSTAEIDETLDRCIVWEQSGEEVTKSTMAAYRRKSGFKGKNGFAGINTAVVVDSPNSNVDKIIEKAQQFGMQYNLAMVTSYTADSVAGSVEFIEKNDEFGMTPIIRMCYIGVCNFDTPDKIIAFFQDIARQTSVEFVAMIGPNEPGTGSPSEMSGFGFTTYSQLAIQTNSIARQLANLSVRNGGNLIISPGAFNLSNAIGNDVYELLYNPENTLLNDSLYDVMMGNAYNDASPNNAYDWYTAGTGGKPGMKEWVDEHDMKVIMTEFGIIADVSSTSDYVQGLRDYFLARAVSSFGSYCNDENVVGALFYRGVDVFDGQFNEWVKAEHFLTDDEVNRVIGGCNKGTKTEAKEKRVWFDCNFDVGIYEPASTKIYNSEKAKAKPSDLKPLVEPEQPAAPQEETATQGVPLHVSFDGGNFFTHIEQVIQINMPIRSFGSNSIAGTTARPYVPGSVNAAAIMSAYPEYAPLNQFAGELKSSSGFRYGMPWLGSAINNTSIFYKTSYNTSSIPLEGAIFSDELKSLASPGSLTEILSKEALSDSERGLAYTYGYNSPGYSTSDGFKIADELTLISDSAILSKQNFDNISILRGYDPLKVNDTYTMMKNSSGKEILLIENPDQFVPGPEVLLETKRMWTGNEGDLCRLYAGRNRTDMDPKLTLGNDDEYLNCSVKDEFYTLPETGVQYYCPNVIACNQAGFDAGTCNIDTRFLSCLKYNNEPNDKIYISADEDLIPEDPGQLEIPQIFESLYEVYRKVKQPLEDRPIPMKLVVQENIGWKIEVNRMFRDANELIPKNLLSDYLYAGTDIENYKVNYQPELIPNYNLFPLQGKYKETDYQFYEWLGLLDVFQEWQAAYVDNSTLAPEKDISQELEFGNPFRGKQLTDEIKTKYTITAMPNVSRQRVFAAGYANLLMSQPLMTCDQVEIGKQFTMTTLIDFLKNESGLSDKDAETFAAYMWPFDFKLTRSVNCITDFSDTRFTNILDQELCKRGYEVEGTCSNKCEVESVPTGFTQQLSCPIQVSHGCFQGPEGGYSHCIEGEDDLPLDLFPNHPASFNVTEYEAIKSANPSPIAEYAAAEERFGAKDLKVVSPEDGEIVFLDSYTYGGRIGILGDDSKVYYQINHIDPDNVPAGIAIGTKVKEGDHIANIWKGYGYRNAHIHVTAQLDGRDGKYIDPYTIYGELLGCSAKRPTPGLSYQDAASSGMCVVGTGTLNDLACDKSYVATASDSEVKLRYSSTENTSNNNNSVSNGNSSSGNGSPISFEGSSNNCSFSNCQDLPAPNGVNYPSCPATWPTLCGNPGKMNQLFGNGDPNLPYQSGVVCDNIADSVGASISKQVITFLGNKFTVNKKLVDLFAKIEKDIQSQAVSFDGNKYLFKSSGSIPYEFKGNGGFNARPVRGYEGTYGENCVISNHSWGTAIDMNAGENGWQAAGTTCNIDMPPEVVYAFEQNGFRWGGRYGGQGVHFDPMHFEFCADDPSKYINTNIGGIPSNGDEFDEDGPLMCESPKPIESCTDGNCNNYNNSQGTASAASVKQMNCVPSSGNETPNKNYSNIYGLLQAVGTSQQFDPAMLSTFLSVEYFGLTQTRDNNERLIERIYSGNPNQYWEMLNGLGCMGPGQFCYGSIKDYFTPEGQHYQAVLNCANSIGVSTNTANENMCPMTVGNAACAMAVFNNARWSWSNPGNPPGIEWTNPEDRSYAAYRYYGSCETSSGKVYCDLMKGIYPSRGYNMYSDLF